MKIKQKLPRKVAEERDLNLGEIIYLDLISHKKPIYGGSKNWIRIQDSDTKQKWYFSTKAKSYFTEKVTPFINKTNTMKKNVKTIRCDNAGENKTTKENYEIVLEEINFKFTSPGTPQQNGIIERGLATLYPRMSATMAHMGQHVHLKAGILPK